MTRPATKAGLVGYKSKKKNRNDKEKGEKIYTKQQIFENLSKQGKNSAQLEKNFSWLETLNFLTGRKIFLSWVSRWKIVTLSKETELRLMLGIYEKFHVAQASFTFFS